MSEFDGLIAEHRHFGDRYMKLSQAFSQAFVDQSAEIMSLKIEIYKLKIKIKTLEEWQAKVDKLLDEGADLQKQVIGLRKLNADLLAERCDWRELLRRESGEISWDGDYNDWALGRISKLLRIVRKFIRGEPAPLLVSSGAPESDSNEETGTIGPSEDERGK